MPVFRLKCQTQQYAWGKIGSDSAVAQLASSGSGVEIDESQPYAELWMGTHPNGPSYIASGESAGTLLSKHIQEHPEVLGEQVQSTFSGLPFLLKVLSVNKALSIQAHPDKARAEALHGARPDVYKDPNHKPEMALALTDFEAMCGFRPLQEIAAHLRVPQFRAVVGEEVAAHFSADPSADTLRELFTALMTADPEHVARLLGELVDAIESVESSPELRELIPRLNRAYPGDVGCFCPFLLNILTLAPGEALFLGANEPHAYLSGNCVECMACSDNVVRAGLTPKLRDVDTLTEMLTYRTASAAEQILCPSRVEGNVREFSVPVNDFSLSETTIPAGDSADLAPRAGPAIVLITSGTGTLDADVVVAGQSFFLPANTAVKLSATSNEMRVHVAFCEV